MYRSQKNGPPASGDTGHESYDLPQILTTHTRQTDSKDPTMNHRGATSPRALNTLTSPIYLNSSSTMEPPVTHAHRSASFSQPEIVQGPSPDQLQCPSCNSVFKIYVIVQPHHVGTEQRPTLFHDTRGSPQTAQQEYNQQQRASRGHNHPLHERRRASEQDFVVPYPSPVSIVSHHDGNQPLSQPRTQNPISKVLNDAPVQSSSSNPKNSKATYPCPYCDKTYLSKRHLKRHNLRHTGERPYQCLLCHETFTRSDVAKRHCLKCGDRRGNQIATFERIPRSSQAVRGL